jgi:hypothetical protein
MKDSQALIMKPLVKNILNMKPATVLMDALPLPILLMPVQKWLLFIQLHHPLS